MEIYKKKFCTLSLFFLILLYIKFSLSQYTELFYEAQFLHIDFIQDLVQGIFNAKNLFTTFGEHLFPGYNLLLFTNYKLFGITSLFELVCSVISSIAIACILSIVATKERRSWWGPIVIFAIILSPVQNIMSGMALAAHISTLILVLILYSIYFRVYKLSNLFFISILVPLYVVFFSGAYAIGFLATLASIGFLSELPKDKKLLGVLFGLSIISYGAYYFLLGRYGYGLHGSVAGYHYKILSIAEFADLMLGSSLLGKAFFEKYKSLAIYYTAGFYIFCMILVFGSNFIFKIKNKLSNPDKFFIALLVYALANVVIVSIARNINGVEGALGQWYQAHLKFIPVAIAYFLSTVQARAKGYIFIKYFLLWILIGFLTVGYFYEYQKGPYVEVWKNNIKAFVPEHLIHPEAFLSSSKPDPLMWDAHAVEEGLMFLYKNGLSYFRKGSVMYSGGLTEDGWIEQTGNDYFDIICPYNSQSVVLQVDHLNEDDINLLAKTFQLSELKPGEAYQAIYNFNNEIKGVSLNLSKFSLYKNINSGDLRKLIFHLSNVQCS